MQFWFEGVLSVKHMGSGFQPKINPFPSLHLKICGSGGTAYDHALITFHTADFLHARHEKGLFCRRHKSLIIER